MSGYFRVTMGIIPGYRIRALPDQLVLNVVVERWHEILSALSPGLWYPSATVTVGRAVYRSDHGCPPTGRTGGHHSR